MATFGDRLKLLRKKKHLTQEQLGKVFFLDKSSISKYEHDINLPENDLLQKLADYFNCSVDFMLGRTDLENYSNVSTEFDVKNSFPSTIEEESDTYYPTDRKKEIQPTKDALSKELANKLLDALSKDGYEIKDSDIPNIIMAAKIVLQTNKNNQD